ncbi:hypothetical protein [Pandoraea pnomenusa]|uniref:hypothetical protein n=1 Tax=Pandoraea pnomenusa TaxID=93220 RepID=UPI003342E16B
MATSLPPAWRRRTITRHSLPTRQRSDSHAESGNADRYRVIMPRVAVFVALRASLPRQVVWYVRGPCLAHA